MDLTWSHKVRAQLAKKASFEAAVHELAQALSKRTDAACDPAVAELVDRSFTLLRTRYTSEAFWRAGRLLYVAAAEAADRYARSSEAVGFKARYLGYVKACDEHLSEPAQAEGATAAAAVLFEGQLSSGTELPPQQRGLEELLALAALQFPSAQDAEAAAGDRDGQPGAPAVPVQLDVALERELEAAIAASLADAEAGGARPGGPPPAAKFAVRALRTEVLNADGLAALGGAGTECCVCREELAEGERVQVMPCSAAHAFHPPCLKPWLAQHNSCPICRHELPTDDERYERRKARDAQEAEDRKGAANAVIHTEFLYT